MHLVGIYMIIMIIIRHGVFPSSRSSRPGILFLACLTLKLGPIC